MYNVYYTYTHPHRRLNLSRGTVDKIANSSSCSIIITITPFWLKPLPHVLLILFLWLVFLSINFNKRVFVEHIIWLWLPLDYQFFFASALLLRSKNDYKLVTEPLDLHACTAVHSSS